jgi:tungstate transport system substrate-binding protein
MRAARGLAAALALAGGLAHAAELRLGATHTLQDSGILAVLVAAFSSATGVKVRALVAGTGQAMRYAEKGDVDVVFTHSRADEERLVARGIGKARAGVMHNDFVLVGPTSDPARVRGTKDTAVALARIRQAGARFVSRGDDSGTHKKELQLWEAVGGLRAWPGYLAAGQGAGRMLMMAHELDAYGLVDRATHRHLARRFALPILVEGDARLLNEYGVTALRSTAALPRNERDADRFAAWLVSADALRLIEGYRIEGEQVFRPGPPP